MALYNVATNLPPAALDLNQIISLLNGTSGPMNGGITIANRVRAQLSGATATSGLVGMSAVAGSSTGGPPTTGTWAAGDLMVDPVLLCLWVCTTGGTPGTWFRLGGGATCGSLVSETTGQGFTTRSGRSGFDVVLFETANGQIITTFPGSNASQAAITIQYAGTYLFTGAVTLGGGTTGSDAALVFLKNGVTYEYGSQFLGYGTPALGGATLMTCAVNDVVQLGVYTEGVYSTTSNAYGPVQLLGLHMSN